MMKRLTVFFLLVCSSLLVAAAQDATLEPTAIMAPLPAETVLNAPTPRELLTVLAWGEHAFEPSIWLASGQEDLSRTTTLWRADGIGGLGYATLLHFEDGIALNQIPAVFNDQWFQTTLSNYAVWRENHRCELGNVQLYEFALQNASVNYAMRYWVEWRSDTRVMAFFLVFPAADTLNMETYAARMYPELAACTGSVG